MALGSVGSELFPLPMSLAALWAAVAAVYLCA